MSEALQLVSAGDAAVEVRRADGRPLFRYVIHPRTPAGEAPRPYVHPLYSLDGDLLTNFRPNDHPWHHALSLTLTSVDGVNFWGGPSHRAGEGYAWRDDHGVQVHRSWTRRTPEELEHTVDWCEPRGGRLLLHEMRTLRCILADDSWSLEWRSALFNAAGHDLPLHNYHSQGGLEGSHYTGLQFRGARGLLDEHGDATIGMRGEGGRDSEAALHGASARWVEWHAQHDGSLRRTRLRFENLAGPLPWFLRRPLPLVAFAPHREAPLVLGAGRSLTLEHRLTFART